MKLKRLIVALLVLSMVAVLTGCGGGTTSESETGEGTKTESTGTPSGSEKEKTKFTVWHIETIEEEAKTIDDSFARFTKDYPQYEVETVPTENAPYKTKLKVAMAAGDLPDLFIHWSGGPMNSYVDAGLLADLTEYMNRDNYKDKYLDAGIAQATYKDKIWAVPIEDITVAMVFYNKEIFEKYNLEIPKTLSELENVCDTLKSNGIIPFALANKEKHLASIYYMYLVERYGSSEAFYKAANRVDGGSFEDEAFVWAGNKAQEWVKKGYFNEGFNGMENGAGQDRQLLYSGDAAMMAMGSWVIGQIRAENPDFLKKLDAFPFPSIEGGKGDPTAVVGTIGNNFYSVSAKCPDVEGAFKAITYLLDDIALKERVAQKKIPPIKGIEDLLDDPLNLRIVEFASKASNVQLWYDQYLSPELAELHKDTCQELFALQKTPEQVNAEMEAAIAKQ
jgi:raffinose/stachyose/melibiose transport system substrate-binding protein